MNIFCFSRFFPLFRRKSFGRRSLSGAPKAVLNSLLSIVDEDFLKNENYQFYISQEYDDLYKSIKLAKSEYNASNSGSVYDKLKISNLMLFKTFVKEKYGGIGIDHTNFAYLIERLGPMVDISYLMIVNQLLCCQAINKYGNEKQKNHYLKKLSNGESFGTFCLHELSSGNNIYMMEGSAEYCSNSRTYKVSAKKNWIFNAQFMNICIVFVKMKNEKGLDCISAFIKDSPLSMPGLHITKCENVLNISNVWDVTFDNVTFSEDDLLGEVGEGFKIAIELQNSARFAIAAAFLGIMKHSMNKILNLNISSSDVNAKVVKWASDIFTVESALYFTTNMADDHLTFSFDVEYAALKVQASKMAFEVINGCIDLTRLVGKDDSYYLNLLDIIRGLELFLGSSDVLTYYVGSQAIQHNLPLIKEDILKIRNIHEHIMWNVNRLKANHIPSFYRDCSIDKNLVAVTDCLLFLKNEIMLSISKQGFNIPNQDALQVRLGQCLVTIYHLLAVIGHHKLLSKDKMSYETEVLIKRSMDILRNELIDTIGEKYDRISLNISNTKYRSISKIVTKNEVHGIESAITRNW